MKPCDCTGQIQGKRISVEKYVKKLNECLSLDTESAHGEADDILCEVLTEIGLYDVVSAFKKVRKWYA